MDVIARVGDLYIGQEEFELSYQFNPYFTNISAPNRAKNLLLLTLIAEKMLVQESFLQKLPELPLINQLSAQYRREALIEELWQKKIRGQIEVSEEEIFEAYLQSKRIRYFKFLTFADRESAERAYQHLTNGLSLTEVARLIGLDSQFIPTDSITFGSELNALEKQVFQLPVNGVSAPFKLGAYYFVINFFKEKTDIFTSEDDYNRRYTYIKKTILRRKQLQSFQDYTRQRFRQAPYQLNRDQFKALVQQLEKVLPIGKETNNQSDLISNHEANSGLGNILDKPVVSFSNGNIFTNRELLQRLKVAPYPIEFSSPGKYRSSMIAATKMILDDDVLVQLAEEEDLGKSPYVNDQLRIWREYLIYQFMRTKFFMSISNAEMPADSSLRSNPAKEFDAYLASFAGKYKIHIFHTILDTLTLAKTDMAVMKQHFPKRTLVPLIQPIYPSSAFESIISDKLIQN